MSKLPSNQIKKVLSGVLSLLAILAAVGTLTGFEAKLFATNTDQDSMIDSITKKITKISRDADKLRPRIETTDLQGAYVISEKAAVIEPERESEQPDESANMDYLYFTGVVTLSDNSKRVIMDGSYLAEGSSVRGCQIQSISDTHIEVIIDGKLVVVPYREKVPIERTRVAELVLDRIIDNNGRRSAVFHGKVYNVGDWIDSETIIQIITPTRVQVKRNGEQLILTPAAESEE